MNLSKEHVPLSALLSSRLLSALVVLVIAIVALADNGGCTRIAASAELSKRGAMSALKLVSIRVDNSGST
jgi:hypothetical protein